MIQYNYDAYQTCKKCTAELSIVRLVNIFFSYKISKSEVDHTTQRNSCTEFRNKPEPEYVWERGKYVVNYERLKLLLAAIPRYS